MRRKMNYMEEKFIKSQGIVDNITSRSWLDEEPYKAAIPRNDVSFNDSR